jgi:hypothetical protein
MLFRFLSGRWRWVVPDRMMCVMDSVIFDLEVDFMDMQLDRRLWTRLVDARPGFTPVAGTYVTVGNEDADCAVARILSTDADGRIELEVLRGPVEAHADLLATG